MLKKITNDALITECVKCKKVSTQPLRREMDVIDPETNETITVVFGKWNEFLQEYMNYATVPCEDCGTWDIINLNIPTDEMEELELEKEEMPFNEINQRYYVRQLIRLVRHDFQKSV